MTPPGAITRALALGAAATVAAIGPALADDPEAALDRARELLSAGRTAEAEAILEDVVRVAPGLADAHHALAEALHARGRTREAVRRLLHVGRGLIDSGDPDTGLEYLEDAVKLSPTSLEARAAAGEACIELQRFRRGAQHLERVLQRGAPGASTRLRLAAAYWELGRLDEAEELYERTVRDAPSVAELVDPALGALRLWRGRYAEALAPLRRAAGRRPDSPAVRFDLARALEGAGRLDDALREYRGAVSSAPDSPKLRYRLAILLRKLGHADDARRELERFRELHAEERRRVRDEGRLRAELDFGWDLIDRAEHARAAEHFAGLPDSPESRAGRANALAGAGRVEQAIDELEQAIARYPEARDLRTLLARVRVRAERPRP